MPSNTYPSGEPPFVLTPGLTYNFDILVSDSFVITQALANVQISSPDEGSGPDATTMEVLLYRDGADRVDLQYFGGASLANVTYDTDRAPYSGSMTTYNGLTSNANWRFTISNISFIANATINALSIILSYTTANVALIPTAPAIPTIPGGVLYSRNGIIPKKNIMSTMNLIGQASVSTILDKVQRVPFNANLNNIRVIVSNTGSVTSTKLSLYKFSGGIITKLIDQGIILQPGNTYMALRYFNRNSTVFQVNQGDLIYAAIDQVGVGVQDLILCFNLSEQ